MRAHGLRSLLLGSLLAAGAAGVVASAMADPSETRSAGPDAQATPLPLERTIATQVDRRLVAAFKSFASPAAARDVLPARARDRLTAMPNLGVNPDLARFVRTGPDGESYYFVAGTDSLALVNQAGSGMIDDIDHALSGDSVGTQDCAGDDRDSLRVVGLLPADARDPVIPLADGSTSTLDAVDRVYVVVFPKVQSRLPVTVEWTSGGQRGHAAVPVPSDILAGRCRGAGNAASAEP
jgi:hypothetical protein